MRRLHAFELHDQPWFPAPCRALFQRALGRLQVRFGVYDEAVSMLAEVVRRSGAWHLDDLCSGSGDVATWMVDRLAERGLEVTARLSDLFPDEALAGRFDGHPRIEVVDRPVDALTAPIRPHAFTTLFASFHHFEREEARALLGRVARDAAGFAAFESSGRTWRHLLLTPLAALPATAVCAVGLRPWRPEHLLWSPLVGLAAMIDGTVSNLRTATVEELEALVREVETPADFTWRVGTLPMGRPPMGRLPLRITYLVGGRDRAS